MTWLADNVSWLAGQVQSADGSPVVIRRGASDSGSITATLSVTQHEVWDADNGIPTKRFFSDWVFTKSEIVLDGSAIDLRPGDLILAGSRQFEVTPIDDKRPCVEPHDAAGVMVVVHSQEVT